MPHDFLTAFDVSYRTALDTALTNIVEDALANGRVLTVAANRPAVDLARQVEDTAADVVIVVDTLHAAKGYVFPDWVVQQVMSQQIANRIPSFAESISMLADEPIDTGLEHIGKRLNFNRPVEQTCPGPPAHITLGPVPCRHHR